MSSISSQAILLAKAFNLRLIWSEYTYIGTPYENINKDIMLIQEKIANAGINKNNEDISPPFFENMMSLIFEKQ